MMADFK